MVSVDATQVVRPVTTQLLGVNVGWWDSTLNSAQTQQMVEAAGSTIFRFPGGSSSDDFHFNIPESPGSDSSMASFIASVNGQGMVTLDYGSGSPQEAAAFLAYLNAPVGNTTPIGMGQEWSDSANAWQTVNFQTAGYWASLRASAPLAQDDGLNFLRLDHPAPFGFHYFEVGNEEYGDWEIDHHAVQHDPATYVNFAAQFAGYAATIDPTISIGVDTEGPDSWLTSVLQQSVAQGFMPGFLSDHDYVQAPGTENDSQLLLGTYSLPGNIVSFSVRAADYESLLAQYFGSSAPSVQLLATEFNTVYSDPGKQTTSLVNGLWLADTLGQLLQSPYDGALFYALTSGTNPGGNNSASLYGWRNFGDLAMMIGPNFPYPTYFAEQLGSKIIQAGGSVVQASSSDPNLSTYAVRESNGHLDLLVINKSPSGPLTGQFQFNGFQPAGQAQVWQYGETQDNAASQSPTDSSALANFNISLGLSGSSFSTSFPAYSMTVLDLTPGSQTPPSGSQTPAIVDAGFESPSVGTGTYSAFVYNPANAGWTFSGGSGVAGNGSGFTSGNPNAPEGTQVGFLQGAGSMISQAVANWPAGTYVIAFNAAQRGNYQYGGQDFQVLVDGTVVDTFDPSGTSYLAVETAPFTVAAGTHTLSFQGLDTVGGDNTVFLDAVSIVAVPVAVGDAGFESPSLGTGTYSAFVYNPANGSGGPSPPKPGRGGQRQRLHLRQPGGPRRDPGRLPPGGREHDQPVGHELAGRDLRDRLRRRPARQLPARRPGLRGPHRRQGRRDVRHLQETSYLAVRDRRSRSPRGRTPDQLPGPGRPSAATTPSSSTPSRSSPSRSSPSRWPSSTPASNPPRWAPGPTRPSSTTPRTPGGPSAPARAWRATGADSPPATRTPRRAPRSASSRGPAA